MTHTDELKKRVYEANMSVFSHGLAKFTWGNASEICRQKNIVCIKPSGVEYEKMTPEDMVILDLSTGEVIEGKLKPSSDTPTHLELYRRFPNIGGVVHTHSRYATIFSQSMLGIPPLGTTHADYFFGEIPCTRTMTPAEISADYEQNTGKLIADTCKTPDEIPAALVANHGPFVWGKTAADAVFNAVVLEEVAFMAWENLQKNPAIPPISRELLEKHYLRKHGAGAYYGQ